VNTTEQNTNAKSSQESNVEFAIFDPISVKGQGDSVTESIEVPSRNAIAIFKHNGESNFSVRQYDASFNRIGGLVNEIVVFHGSKLLISNYKTIFEVSADGNWEIEIVPFFSIDSGSFDGEGAKVSGIFKAPNKGALKIIHSGDSNFSVRLYSSKGRKGYVNEIGSYDGTVIVDFGIDTAFWVVEADGKWSIAPR